MLLTAKWVIFQPYHGENKLHFDEKMMMSALYWTNTLIWIFNSASSLNQQYHYPNSKPTSLCSYCLMYCILNIENKPQVTKQHDYSWMCISAGGSLSSLFGYKWFIFDIWNARVVILLITHIFFLFVLW